MTEPTTNETSNNEPDFPVRRGCIDETTCACGEKHYPHDGHNSQRESCTSSMKFGNSCCCQPDNEVKTVQHRCGHPRQNE